MDALFILKKIQNYVTINNQMLREEKYMKRWEIKKPEPEIVGEIMRKTDLTSLCAEILVSRGYVIMDMLVKFFNNDELSDPLMLRDMPKAVEVISQAIYEGEFICVYGDYDCDGVTATTILVKYLESSGADVMYYIPDRDEGYGLNCNAIDKLKEQGVSLIITVDNGIQAVEEAEYIKKLGMKLVITDHHQPGDELPVAEAVVNPNRSDCPSPCKDLAGVGVAFKLCAALDGDYSIVLEQFSDLVAVGTIADVVPLRGENRALVRYGFEMIKNSENYGLLYLLEKCGINKNTITAANVSFGLSPRINAAGRFASASIAVEALISEDEGAKFNVDNLIMLNNRRRETENLILKDIFEYIDLNPDILYEKVLVLSGKGWHHGVIGIVSSKIMELYGKPNIIISVDDDGIGRGSERSFEGFNVYKCLKYCEDTLEKYGGHKRAGGLTIKAEEIPRFIKLVSKFASECEKLSGMKITADKLLEAKDFDLSLVESLKVLEPFGEGNRAPIFAIIGAVVNKIIPLSQGKHSKIEFSYDGITQTALMFSRPPETLSFNCGDRIDMLVNLEVTEYNGSSQLSIKVVDFRNHGISGKQYFAAKSCYEAYKRGEGVPRNVIHRIKPSRDELVRIYKYIMAIKRVSIDKLFMKFNTQSMNYFKLRICLDAFNELGLIKFIASRQVVQVVEVLKKVDLSQSTVLNDIYSL